jgi:hypothetical protein
MSAGNPTTRFELRSGAVVGAIMSIKLADPVSFTDRDVTSIVKALSVETNLHRRDLLPEVLREWAKADLREHAHLDASGASAPDQGVRCKRVARSAKELQNAIDAIEADDPGLIAFALGHADGSIPMRERDAHFARKLIEHRDFLNRLQAAGQSLSNQLKRGPGHPRNVLAYLVLRDIAAIFEWLTGLQARREVDRARSCETGAFYHFCEAVWPPVFASGLDGLPAAMKNWAFAHRKYNDTSALIANIAMRHPSWGVFDR